MRWRCATTTLTGNRARDTSRRSGRFICAESTNIYVLVVIGLPSYPRAVHTSSTRAKMRAPSSATTVDAVSLISRRVGAAVLARGFAGIRCRLSSGASVFASRPARRAAVAAHQCRKSKALYNITVGDSAARLRMPLVSALGESLRRVEK